MKRNAQLLDHLVKAWFAYVATKPPCTDFLKLPTGLDLITQTLDPVTEHIELAMRIVGQQCEFDKGVMHTVCLRNRTHGYRIVRNVVDSAWHDG